jgi:hypothetical protein
MASLLRTAVCSVLGPGDVVGGTSLTVLYDLSINNSGTIAFNGYEFRDCSVPAGCQIYPDFPGVNGIFTQDGLLVEEGSILDGKLLSYIPPSGTAINDAGTVAFHASFAGGSGLFTQDGLVAGTGTVVDGREISSVSSLWRIALNDHGDLAFHASFTDGSEAILMARRADAVVPEPSAAQMTAIGLVIAAAGSRLLRNRASSRAASRALSCPPGCR